MLIGFFLLLLLRSEHAHCLVTYGKIAISLFVTRADFFWSRSKMHETGIQS